MHARMTPWKPMLRPWAEDRSSVCTEDEGTIEGITSWPPWHHLKTTQDKAISRKQKKTRSCNTPARKARPGNLAYHMAKALSKPG